jgi:hypothetical protein
LSQFGVAVASRIAAPLQSPFDISAAWRRWQERKLRHATDSRKPDYNANLKE